MSNDINSTVMEMVTYMNKNAGEEIILVKEAAQQVGLSYMSIEDLDMLSKEFLRLHPEYHLYQIYDAETPISYQSRICCSVFVKAEINEAKYLLAQSMEDISSEQKLRYYRQRAGLTQAALAELADIKVRTLQHYESGTRDLNNASARTVKQLAEALNVRMESLID